MKILRTLNSENLQRPTSRLQPGSDAKKVFQGEIFSVYQWQQKLFTGEFATFEMLRRADTVTILPVTSTGKIILTDQEQPGYSAFLDLPGGVLDSGETPLAAAQRELAEEVGLLSDDWSLWFVEQASGKIDWANFIFVARQCRFAAQQRPDAGEKIQVLEKDWSAFEAVLRSEKFRNRGVALQYLRMSPAEQANFRQELFA
jgi:ADP-ribose pyrophosphatase